MQQIASVYALVRFSNRTYIVRLDNGLSPKDSPGSQAKLNGCFSIFVKRPGQKMWAKFALMWRKVAAT
ncbi:MAG: hypothetical protein C0507_17755 [Cyanobacteria bacterium PR.3.49]|nr:hypothetical protein [Cyanobacteria bacterium PR.3.49]